VLDGNQILALKNIHLDFAKLSGHDMDILRQVTASQGADIYVIAYAHVIGPTPNNRIVPGETQWIYTATGMARAFWTDTGEIIDRQDQRAKAADADRHAGKLQALRQARDLIRPKLMTKLLGKWNADRRDGRFVTISLLNADFEQAREFKRVVRGLIGQDMTARAANGISSLSFKFKGPVDELAEKIKAQHFEKIRGLVVREALRSSIRLEVKN
ncbi:MAG TPA: hypothetical protein VMV81_05930, partial [Phycisphaerae bacterium]|nr:hypothetical protein [Phycisphaerae bacterium]